MSNRALYGLVLIIGIIVLLVSIFAHQLGLGSAAFGAKKIIGVIIGIVLILAGLWGMQNSRVAV